MSEVESMVFHNGVGIFGPLYVPEPVQYLVAEFYDRPKKNGKECTSPEYVWVNQLLSVANKVRCVRVDGAEYVQVNFEARTANELMCVLFFIYAESMTNPSEVYRFEHLDEVIIINNRSIRLAKKLAIALTPISEQHIAL